MKIGNIIYDAELVNHTKVSYINYINESRTYKDLDLDLPTLYVGWSFMKTCNPDDEVIQNADILKKKIITNKLYYEFSFHESKPSHVKGVDTFANLAPQFYFEPKYKYINLDPVFFQIKTIDELFQHIPNNVSSVYVFKNEMLYVHYDDVIAGINLLMYDFFQFNIDVIINTFKSRTIRFTEDSNGEIYQKQYKFFPNFEQLKRYLVTL